MTITITRMPFTSIPNINSPFHHIHNLQLFYYFIILYYYININLYFLNYNLNQLYNYDYDFTINFDTTKLIKL